MTLAAILLNVSDLPADGAGFAHQLREALAALAEEVDRNFPQNDSVAWGPNGLVIRKVEKKEPPPQLAALDQARNDALGLHSVIDVLTETEKWLDLHKLFRPQVLNATAHAAIPHRTTLPQPVMNANTAAARAWGWSWWSMCPAPANT